MTRRRCAGIGSPGSNRTTCATKRSPPAMPLWWLHKIASPWRHAWGGGEIASADAELAVIVRGADTARPELAPQAAGLLAISLGLSYTFRDDREMSRHGLVMYDALYAWCRHTRGETKRWNPMAPREQLA